MTQAKRQLVEGYIESLSCEVDAYNDAGPEAMNQAENNLFGTIIETCNVFSIEISDIDTKVLLRKGTGVRDANTVLGILRLYLANDEETNSDKKHLKPGAEITPKIFISHRSIDKNVADIFETFLTTCGISYNNIFCSSLPGNDIEEKISLEVKENLKASVLNVVILSADYYQSAYCQNEAGIIWFLDTEKIVIALPEVDDNAMEGFLNSEHKIRRLNSNSDISAICDIVKRFFSAFITSNAKLNSNIDRLIGQYNELMRTRTVSPPTNPNENNKLETRILANEFSDAELAIFYYFYDTQTNAVGDDLININQWLGKKKMELSIMDGFDALVDDEIVGYIFGNFERESSFKMYIGEYRELRRLSQKAIDFFEQNCSRHKKSEVPVKSETPDDNLIIKGFTGAELLLVQYILDLQRKNLLAGWQSEQEIKTIKNWEEINKLNDYLSQNYDNALSKLEIRKLIEPCAKTVYGNTKEYKIKDAFLESIGTLGEVASNQIKAAMEENKHAEPDLPF